MDTPNRLPAIALFLLLLSACIPGSGQRIDIPTLAMLPSLTPTRTDTPMLTDTPTITPTRTATRTPTPNRAETEIAALRGTNAAAQATLDTLLTLSVPTLTPSISVTPSATPLPTVAAMAAQWVYAQTVANLRACASSRCEAIAQLQPGEAVAADGMIPGEELVAGSALWYRVDAQGRELYVYSLQVSFTPPTLPPAAAPPTFTPSPTPTTMLTTAPILNVTAVPQQDAAGCPNVKASCSELTCAQAYACLAAGNSRLDGDKDGVPCESICK